jgi:thiol-disulfide isomerase/thioredoxin
LFYQRHERKEKKKEIMSTEIVSTSMKGSRVDDEQGNPNLKLICYILVMTLLIVTFIYIFFPNTEKRLRKCMGISNIKSNPPFEQISSSSSSLSETKQIITNSVNPPPSNSPADNLNGFIYFYSETCPKCDTLTPFVIQVFEQLYGTKGKEFETMFPLHTFNTSDYDDAEYCQNIDTIPRLYYQNTQKSPKIKTQYPNIFEKSALEKWVNDNTIESQSPTLLTS